MKSQTQVEAQLELLKSDLADWQTKFNKCVEPDRRRILGNTICGVEGQIESLQWVLEEH